MIGRLHLLLIHHAGAPDDRRYSARGGFPLSMTAGKVHYMAHPHISVTLPIAAAACDLCGGTEELSAFDRNAVNRTRGGLTSGLSDLSGSLGVPGQPNHPSVQAAVEQLMAAAARRDLPVSLSVRSPGEVRDALKRGARLASVGTLETVLYQALRGWLQQVAT
jgi:hypothetical protein